MAAEENIPHTQLEEIERFLQQDMTAEEEKKFRSRMEQHPALEQQVAEMRLIIIGIEEAALQRQMNVFHEGAAFGKLRWLNNASWLAAASVIIIIVAALFWFARSPQPQKLFAEYFIPDAGLITSMGASENYTFDRAMIDYKTGKYDEAINAWRSLPKSDSTNYFIASAYIAMGNADSAIVYFNKALSVKTSAFYDDANWYLGLSLLNLNQPTEAIPYIKQSTRKEKETLLLKLTP